MSVLTIQELPPSLTILDPGKSRRILNKILGWFGFELPLTEKQKKPTSFTFYSVASPQKVATIANEIALLETVTNEEAFALARLHRWKPGIVFLLNKSKNSFSLGKIRALPCISGTSYELIKSSYDVSNEEHYLGAEVIVSTETISA